MFFLQVEEQILERLVWKTGSPIHDAIKAAGKVPSCEDVSLQSYQATSAQPVSSQVESALSPDTGSTHAMTKVTEVTRRE